LLGRSLELQGAFAELFDAMEPMQWQAYMDVVLFTAAFWNPRETKKMRDARKRLEEINTLVKVQALQLEQLLGERTELCNEHSFFSGTAYHVNDLIERASSNNGLYASFLKPELAKLRSQYDLKYWPNIEEIVGEIGRDAADAKVEAALEITKEAISSRIASRRDFIRAFFTAIDEQKGSTFRDIPKSFNLTDESLAAIICCALDLADNDLIDAAYVKRMRQTEREKTTLDC